MSSTETTDDAMPCRLILQRKEQTPCLGLRVGGVSLVGLLDVGERLLEVPHLLVRLGAPDQGLVVGRDGRRALVECRGALVDSLLESAALRVSFRGLMPAYGCTIMAFASLKHVKAARLQ